MTEHLTNPTEIVHFMADIETLGTRHRPVLTSIGLVAFSQASGILGKFYAGVDIESCMRHGAHIDPKTLLWWLDPKRDAARAEWVLHPKLEIDDAMDAVVAWSSQWDGVAKRGADGDVLQDYTLFERGGLWGKGSTFDCIHLREAALYTGVEWPWSFRDDDCYRTIAKRFPKVAMLPNAMSHSAIADAEAQALHLLAIEAFAAEHISGFQL